MFGFSLLQKFFLILTFKTESIPGQLKSEAELGKFTSFCELKNQKGIEATLWTSWILIDFWCPSAYNDFKNSTYSLGNHSEFSRIGKVICPLKHTK